MILLKHTEIEDSTGVPYNNYFPGQGLIPLYLNFLE